MRKSNKENPMSMMEFAQVVENLTPRQREVINNLIMALLEVQNKLKKVDNAEGEKGVNS